MSIERKIRIDREYSWNTHRGGWAAAMQYLKERLHDPAGTLFLTAVEDRLYYDGAVSEPWVGVMHQVPHQSSHFPDLERIVRTPEWLNSIRHCNGLFVLCDYVRDFLRSRCVDVPMVKIPYPQDTGVPAFSPARYLANPQVVQVGEFLRNHQAFFDLGASGHRKLMLVNPEILRQIRDSGVRPNASVELRERVSDAEYDGLLSESVVFLNLFDAVCVTTIQECIVRATPVLVNRVGAIAEFLGPAYPLYYETLEEAEALLRRPEAIHAAHSYLRRLSARVDLTYDGFVRDVQQTSIYRALYAPELAAGEFRRYDLTIVICSYARIGHIPLLLESLAAQDYAGAYEIILWNNNPETAAELEAIAAGFRDRLTLRLIQSDTNYYCMARFASVALARAPLMLFCDDDVMPGPGYLSHFVREFEASRLRFGPRVAVCVRGHWFNGRDLDGALPDELWDDTDEVEFYSEEAPAREVHFMHADNLIISTDLLRRSLSVAMPHAEWALIDDYWLSFVLSHHLRATLWKAAAPGVFTFTESADDPQVALFHNPRVRHERNRFYLYHMQLGWPGRATTPVSAETEARAG